MGGRFLEGVKFGTGFGLAFLLVIWLGVSLFVTKAPERAVASFSGSKPAASMVEETGPPFYELPIEEQIRKSSVIALVDFEVAPDGKRKAIIREFLKKDPDTAIHYDIGDEYPESSYYPREGRSDNDKLIIFFVGSPATMRMSTTFTGDRISGLSDIPLELFRTKCETKPEPLDPK